MSSGLIKVGSSTNNGGGLIKTTGTSLLGRDTAGIKKADTAFVESTLNTTSKSIGFVIDRTGSREQAWAEAKIEQEKLLKQHGSELKARLVHFGGNKIGDTGWHPTVRPLIDEMNRVKCEGGQTQILESLQRFQNPGEAPGVIMLIGDCFEENENDILPVTKQLALNGTRVFAFQEGGNTRAQKAFATIADITKGSYLKLGDDADVSLDSGTKATVTWLQGGDEALKKLALTGDKAAINMAKSMKLLN